jgi:hypothetical protein
VDFIVLHRAAERAGFIGMYVIWEQEGKLGKGEKIGACSLASSY